jgi:hypothetical protein
MIRNTLDAVQNKAELTFKPDAAREILRMTLAARDSSRSERPAKMGP